MAPNEPDLFDEIDEASNASADARAMADIAAGRVIPHERMVRWLRSWGTAGEIGPPGLSGEA
ncbi:MAG TPA: CopG family transcriptional regulator [Caulobacteraceae bacterium]|jgi:predicted transcriptional regulator|nr:CopG family transcriptional regulator [Caulobacteraceae bacterium]